MPRMRALMGDALVPMLPRRKAAFAGLRVKAGRRSAFGERRILRALMAGAPGGFGPGQAAQVSAAMGKGGIDWSKLAGGGLDLAKKILGGIGGLKGGIAGITKKMDPAAIVAGLTGGDDDDRPARRSMNPANVKALRRAFRREEAFTKLAARVGYVPRSIGAKRATKRARKRKG